MNDPVFADSGALNLAQSNFIQDIGATGNLIDFGGGLTAPDSNSDFSNGEGRIFDTQGFYGVWAIGALDYTIPEGAVDFAVRLTAETGTQARVTATLIRDGTDAGTVEIWSEDGGGVTVPLWFNNDGDPANVTEAANVDLGWTNGDLEPGEYQLRVECEFSGDDVFLDLISIRDERFSYNFDNTLDESGGHLDGPELYPDVFAFATPTVTTRRDVTEASVTSSWDDTSNNQFVETRIGNVAFDRSSNSTTVSTTGGPARSIDVNLGLSRYPMGTNPQNATPRFGYNGQSVDSYTLMANPDAINASGVGETEVDAIVPQGEITGDRIEEAAEITSGGTTLTRSILAPFDVFAETSLRSSENVAFNNDE